MKRVGPQQPDPLQRMIPDGGLPHYRKPPHFGPAKPLPVVGNYPVTEAGYAPPVNEQPEVELRQLSLRVPNRGAYGRCPVLCPGVRRGPDGGYGGGGIEDPLTGQGYAQREGFRPRCC